jgi:hypothetical protein
MKDETFITIGRQLMGTGIIITHMLTGANSTFVILGLFLIGVPIELVQKVAKKEKQV